MSKVGCPYDNVAMERLYNTRKPNFIISTSLIQTKPLTKGAIKAFIQLSEKNEHVHLVLVAHGDYLYQLQKKYVDIKNIHYIYKLDEKNEWLKWMQMFDVGILPTYFKSESLPTVIVEYLSQGKPVIASNIGEIPNMLIQGERTSGIVIESEMMIENLEKAMKCLVEDKDRFNAMKEDTEYLFAQFDMVQCANKYAQFLGMLSNKE